MIEMPGLEVFGFGELGLRLSVEEEKGEKGAPIDGLLTKRQYSIVSPQSAEKC